MKTIHLVSHTHWDREWYLPFQVFRMKLIHMVDGLLELMEARPDYRTFMLDGQTIVLDDYLEVRPEREESIRRLVRDGRLLIGPWHVLPDEFLVSPEATVRNLMEGERTARRFGPKMNVGYLPDPFGHIGQMPQILTRFGIDSACAQRGLSVEPCEVWWQAPDGSRVFLAYLRDGYGHGASLPAAFPEEFTAEVRRLRDSLAPHSASDHLLILQGNDHLEPQPEVPAAIAYAQDHLDGDLLLHSTLPAYLAAVRPQAARQDLPTVEGELRSPRRFHLLPGVLSTRIWIKQRNHACETLLEKWAEPFSAWAVQSPHPLLRRAWRLLMECHPHDSICGCSIDQVHEEMRARFDQVEQIAEEITRQSLEAIAVSVDTRTSWAADWPAVVVFNPASSPRTDRVRAELQGAFSADPIEIVDETGRGTPHRLGKTRVHEIANLTLNREGLRSVLGTARGGKISSLPIQEMRFERDKERVRIHIELAEAGEPDAETLSEALAQMLAALGDGGVSTFSVRAVITTTPVEFLAGEVPAHGYRTFWIRPFTVEGAQPPYQRPAAGQQTFTERVIENEFFRVEVSARDGLFDLLDKRSEMTYRGLNRFVDGGDCGDLYNYCPPAQDLLVQTSEVLSIDVYRDAFEQSIQVSLALDVPLALGPGRRARRSEVGRMRITTRVSLSPGVPRLDIHTEVDNPAKDHRLRVHFPAPFAAQAADYDGHFQIVRRSTGVPGFDETWTEQPRPEQPQRAFTSVSDGTSGLLVANRGLPEVEVLKTPEDHIEIALTLLRCTGWLSRGDLTTRQGHAGPGFPTPGAQMPGRWEFDYSLIPFAGQGELPACHLAYAFNAPLRAVMARGPSQGLPSMNSFLQVSPDAFVLSAVKAAEDGRGWIARGYNLGPEPLQVRLAPWQPLDRAARVSLSEQDLDALDVEPDGCVQFTVKGYEIASVRFW
jgi:alpha-mannosidase